MVKTVLRYSIVLALLVTVGALVYAGVGKSYNRIYSPMAGEVFEIGEHPTQIVALPTGAVVIGRYTEGSRAGYGYYKLYNRNGTVRGAGEFHADGLQLQVSQVVVYADGLDLVCTATPRDREQASCGVVYRVDANGKIGEPVWFRAEDGQGNTLPGFVFGFDRFTCIETESGSYFAGMQDNLAVLFDASGNALLRLAPDNTAYVADLCYAVGRVILTGATSENSLGQTFESVLFAAYNLDDGQLLWQDTLMQQAGRFAVGLQIEAVGTDFLLYGRYFEQQDLPAATSEDAANLAAYAAAGKIPVSYLPALLQYEGGMHFHIGADREQMLPSSAFLLRLDYEGNVTGNIVYSARQNDVTPSLTSLWTAQSGGACLQAYAADGEQAPSYTLTMIRLGSALRENVRETVTVSNDIFVLCGMDPYTGGAYLYTAQQGSGTYRMRYFATEASLRSYLDKAESYRPVRDSFFTLRPALPLLFCLYFMMTVCAVGVRRYRDGLV